TANEIETLLEFRRVLFRSAIIKTSFTVKSNDIMAAIPAYKFKAFPSTKGIAVSPDKPINFINGLILSMIHGKTGVYCKNVIINEIGRASRREGIQNSRVST